MAIPGLRYVSDYLDPASHDRLFAAVNTTTWLHDPSGRGFQIYGYSYHHTKGGIHRIDDLPDWAADLGKCLWQNGLMPYVPDQLIATRTHPGRASSRMSTPRSSTTPSSPSALDRHV